MRLVLAAGMILVPIGGLAQDRAVPDQWPGPSIVCSIIDCEPYQPAGQAWSAGRMDDPNHGGFASVGSDSGAEHLVLTCESRGPMTIILRSARMDRGEVQVRVDGAGVEWLMLAQRGGVLVAEIPRGSRLLHALQDGEKVELVAADGRTTVWFGLRGSARAITTALTHCAER